MDKIRTLKAKRGEIVKFMNVLFLIPRKNFVPVY